MILLDEVGELPLSLQAKLLRVLQDGKVRPIGSDHFVDVQVRVIASMNKDLALQVQKGSFREDLFFPAAGHSGSPSPTSCTTFGHSASGEHFLEKSIRKHGVSVQLTREAMIYPWEYDWPGNIRELENLVERLVILRDNGITDLKDLPPNFRCFVSDKKCPPPTLGTVTSICATQLSSFNTDSRKKR